MKNFISANDVADINALVERAIEYKANPYIDKGLGQNKKVGLLFLNPSLRTRLSTQLAAQNLGMECVVFNADKDGWKMEFEEGAVMNGTTVEHIRDFAPVLGMYFDILCIRSFPGLTNREEDYSDSLINQLVAYSGIPVVSLESNTLHPLQSLADIMTIKEQFPFNKKPKVVLTWAPHIKPIPQCVSNSFAQWVNKWGGGDFVITHPEGYELDEAFTNGATIIHNQKEAMEGADFVYVKNWSSYSDYGQVKYSDSSWMMTNNHLVGAPKAKIMHCLPVRRNVELSDEVLDGNQSIVTQLAGNRLWAAQAVLAELIK